MNTPNSAELWDVGADSCDDHALRTLVSVDAWRSKCTADLHNIRSNISLFPARFDAAIWLAIGRKLKTSA